LDERIATGGMGDVWRGTDVVLGRVIAVKVLRPAMLADPEFAARFYGEARMMAAFRHPGVVEVYDYASAGDSPDGDDCAYLVMAYVDGEPLSTRLKDAGQLSVGETLSIVAQTGEALHAAHEHGTIHRDVKPGNLIVRPNGTVMLVDFGVARSNDVTSMTGVNSIVGTALYMAPEQVAKGRVTPATDIYALGAVAYHCLAGRPPFDGDNALQVALRHLEDDPDPLPADVPEQVRALVARAMAKHPADRFSSAAQMAEEARNATRVLRVGGATPLSDGAHSVNPAPTTRMDPATRTRPLSIPPPTPPGAAPNRGGGTPRGQRLVQLAVVALFLLAIGLAVAIWLTSRDDPNSGNNPNDSGVNASEPAANESAAPSTSATRTSRPHGVNPRPPRTRPTQGASSSAPASPPPSTTAPSVPSAEPTADPTETTAPTEAPTGNVGNGTGAQAGVDPGVDG
jgi:serine/threonine-protein kinase